VARVIATQLFGGRLPRSGVGYFGASLYTLFKVDDAGEAGQWARPAGDEVYPFAWLYFRTLYPDRHFLMLNCLFAVIVDAIQNQRRTYCCRPRRSNPARGR